MLGVLHSFSRGVQRKHKSVYHTRMPWFCERVYRKWRSLSITIVSIGIKFQMRDARYPGSTPAPSMVRKLLDTHTKRHICLLPYCSWYTLPSAPPRKMFPDAVAAVAHITTVLQGTEYPASGVSCNCTCPASLSPLCSILAGSTMVRANVLERMQF